MARDSVRNRGGLIHCWADVMSAYLKSASNEWPFIGLRPFRYDDHAYFFGRDEELHALESQIRHAPFVAIVGGSGSGKSSLISAGLRARLEKADDFRWKWIEMRPGDAPIRRLASALANLTGETGDLLEAWADRFERVLTMSSFGMGETLAQIPALREPEISGVLLLVDQFEELFRFANLGSESSLDAATAAERRDEATAIVRLLLTPTRAPQLPIHVVVTMRSDFIGDCARFHGLPEAVSRSQFLVPGMTRDQREDVIRKPIELAEAQIDAALVQRALNDTNEDLDQLPLLQHAMMRCWERAHRRSQETGDRPHLTIADYMEVGGVERALSRHANKILEAFSEEESVSATNDLRLATKRVFQALTETDQDGRSTRNPQRFADLVQYVRVGDDTESASVATNAARTVVRRFASPDCSFLRVIASPEKADGIDEIDTDSIIDIGHEALIRRWDRLQGDGEENWMHEEVDDSERFKRLLGYVAAEATIPVEDLIVLETWWFKRGPNRFWARRYTKRNADKFEEVRATLKRSRDKADAAAEEVRKYECRVIGIVAEAIRVPMEYKGAADSLAMALNKPSDLPNVPEYVELLYRGLGELREIRRIRTPSPQVFALSFAPSGRLLAAAVHGKLLFYDAETGELVHSEEIGGGWVLSLRWSPDGKRIYVGTSPIGLILTPCSIKPLRKYFQDCGDDNLERVSVGNEDYPAGAGAWCHDGNWILVAGWQRRASLWDASRGDCKRVIGSEFAGRNPMDGLFSDIAGSADGRRVAFGATSGRIHILNTGLIGKDGPRFELERTLEPIENNLAPYSLAFDPQNPDRLLAGYMPSPFMTLWNIDKNDSSTFGDEKSGPVWRVAFDRKGEFMAAGSNDTVVRLWPTKCNSVDPRELRGHHASVFSIDVNPENQNVASGSMDGTIRLWSKDAPLSARSLPNAILPPPPEFTLEGSRIHIAGHDGKTYSGTLPEKFGEVGAAAVSANGAAMVVVPRRFGQPLLLLGLRDDRIRVNLPLNGVKSEWIAVAFIENDALIVAKAKDGQTFTWPFYPDVPSLQKLAKDYLPFVRNEDGSEGILEVARFILRQTDPA